LQDPPARRLPRDFCNTIGTTRTFGNVRYSVAVECKADIEESRIQDVEL